MVPKRDVVGLAPKRLVDVWLVVVEPKRPVPVFGCVLVCEPNIPVVAPKPESGCCCGCLRLAW